MKESSQLKLRLQFTNKIMNRMTAEVEMKIPIKVVTMVTAVTAATIATIATTVVIVEIQTVTKIVPLASI